MTRTVLSSLLALFTSGCSCMGLFSEPLGPADGDADTDMDVDTDTDVDTDVDTDADTDVDCSLRPDNADFPFSFSTVDSDTYDSSGASIAVDAEGVVHVAFGNGHLRYATNASGAFIAETVDPDWGGTPSLDVDAAGAVHVAYPGTAGLRYATTETGSWALETIEPLDVENIELVVAPDGSVHVAYTTQGSPGYVRYAVRTTDTFVIEQVAELCGWACTERGGVALAISDDGFTHLLYQDIDGALVHAIKDDLGWARQTVAPDGGLPGGLAVDAAGNLHAAFGLPLSDGIGGQEVDYALGTGVSWSTEIVEPYGRPMSLALGPDGTPNLVWGNHFASRAGGEWNIETVTVDGDVDVDASGDVHVAWSGASDLYYARRVAPDGIDQNCDGIDGVDADRDGYASPGTGGHDCDDLQATVHPGADDPAGDGIDQNCDGTGGPA